MTDADAPEASSEQGLVAETVATAPGRDAAIRYDLRVFRALRRITRAVDLHSRRLHHEHQITGPQLVCLLSVSENPEITPGVMARLVHLSPSTVNGILDRLEIKGLVKRRRASKDRRLVRVSLTADGLALVATAPSPLQDTLAEAMSALPETELATISDSLDRIVELMELRPLDAAPILETGPIERGPGDGQQSLPPPHESSAGAGSRPRVIDSGTPVEREDREKA